MKTYSKSLMNNTKQSCNNCNDIGVNIKFISETYKTKKDVTFERRIKSCLTNYELEKIKNGMVY